MGVYFQKSLKRATALTLIFAVSSPVSATHVTWSSKGGINEDDSFATIASRDITLSIRNDGIYDDGEDDINRPVAHETISYSRAVDAAQNDLQAVKRSVIASDLLTYPQSYENHQTSFQNLITQVYRNTQLSRCQGDPLEEISVKLFKVSQKHLGTSNERPGEWARDEALGGFFTFTFNKNRHVSILVNDLNVVLPLYSNHRYSDGGENTLAPYGVNLTENQRITGQFINRVLNELSRNDPAALKAGIKFRLRPENSTGSLETIFNRFTNRNIPLVQPLVVYAGGYPRANIAGQLSPELEQAMRIAFPPLIEQIKTYCGYASPRVGNAQIFDRLYDPFIEMVLERFVALKQNVRNSPYLMANTTPYGMEQDILRRFELYKRQTSAYNEWTQNPSVYGLQKAVDAYIGWRIPPALVKTGFDLWKQYTGYENTLDGVQWIKTKEGSVGIKDPQTGLSYPIFGAERLSPENFLAEDQPMDGNGLNGMISFMGDYIKQDENMKLAHVKAPLESLCYIIHETYLEMVKDHLNNRPWKEDRKRQVLMDKAEKHMQLTGISYLDQKTPRYKNGVYVKAGLMPRMLGHEVYMLPKMDKYKRDFENRYVQSFLGTQWYKLLDDQEFYFKSKK